MVVVVVVVITIQILVSNLRVSMCACVQMYIVWCELFCKSSCITGVLIARILGKSSSVQRVSETEQDRSTKAVEKWGHVSSTLVVLVVVVVVVVLAQETIFGHLLPKG